MCGGSSTEATAMSNRSSSSATSSSIVAPTSSARTAFDPVRLTRTQFELFELLVANAGRVMTHRQLLRAIWGPGRVEHIQYLRVFMASLRQKLEDDPAQPRLLMTETGIGYRLIAG